MNDIDRTIPPERAHEIFAGEELTLPGRRDRKPDGRFNVGELVMRRYKVLAELGQGGMGVVYKCFDETAGIEVALKALPPELSHNTLEMEDIRDNFQLVSKLVHQNIAISKNLEKDPANRFANARELYDFFVSHYERWDETTRLREQLKALESENALIKADFEKRAEEYEEKMALSENKAAELQDSVTEYREKIDLLETESVELEEQIAEFEKQVAEYKEQIAGYEEKLADCGEMAAADEERITELEELLAEYKEQASANQETISQLEEQTAEYQDQIIGFERRIAELEEQLEMEKRRVPPPVHDHFSQNRRIPQPVSDDDIPLVEVEEIEPLEVIWSPKKR